MAAWRRVLAAVVVGAGMACGPAGAADLYGRVFDTLRGAVYPGAVVVLGANTGGGQSVVTDATAQFRFDGVAPGVYLVKIAVPGGREVIGRLRVTSRPQTQIAHLDLAKIDPPDEGDEY